MKTINIVCDYCKKDLTDAKGMEAYRLVVYAEGIPITGNIRLPVIVAPPIDRTHHFCGMTCLTAWIREEQCQN